MGAVLIDYDWICSGARELLRCECSKLSRFSAVSGRVIAGVLLAVAQSRSRLYTLDCSVKFHAKT
jgi:hypothetical protein